MNQVHESVISGRILDTNGALVPGVEVRLYRDGDKKPRKIHSDADGIYRITGVVPGTYGLEAKLTGFATQKITGIEISKAEVLTINLALQPKGSTWVGTIGDDHPRIDMTSNTSTTIITRDMIEQLPH